MAQRPKWWHMLQAGKREAILAADLYNRTAVERSLEGYVVHMHLAWLYMLQAHFLKTGVDFRYRQPDGRTFERIDGEIKTWELAHCVRHQFPDDNNPARQNVEFFIKLRNRIEHRYEQLIATVIAGKSQALLMNFEETLCQLFGTKEGLADSLRFPVFMSSLTPDAVTTLKRVHRQLPRRFQAFIQEFDAALPNDVQKDWRYDFRVLLLPQTGTKTDSDVAMRFIREEDMTDEQRRARDVVQTIVRTRKVPVQNQGRHKPGVVANKVAEELGIKFTASHHARVWKHFGIRPAAGSDRPEETDERYCVWDEPHRDYLYYDAWIRRVVKALRDPARYLEIVGSEQLPSKNSTN